MINTTIYRYSLPDGRPLSCETILKYNKYHACGQIISGNKIMYTKEVWYSSRGLDDIGIFCVSIRPKQSLSRPPSACNYNILVIFIPIPIHRCKCYRCCISSLVPIYRNGELTRSIITYKTKPTIMERWVENFEGPHMQKKSIPRPPRLSGSFPRCRPGHRPCSRFP